MTAPGDNSLDGTVRIQCDTSINLDALSMLSDAQRFETDPDDPRFTTIDGVLFSRDGTVLLKYPRGRQSRVYIVPETVETIGRGAFAGQLFEDVIIPDSVVYIGERAFMDCTNLRHIGISKNVREIFYGAFFGCKNLSAVDFGTPSKLTYIGARAFQYCELLSNIVIPASVKAIGEMAFEHCKFLRAYISPSVEVREYAFRDTHTVCTYTPSKDGREGITGWLDYERKRNRLRDALFNLETRRGEIIPQDDPSRPPSDYSPDDGPVPNYYEYVTIDISAKAMEHIEECLGAHCPYYLENLHARHKSEAPGTPFTVWLVDQLTKIRDDMIRGVI